MASTPRRQIFVRPRSEIITVLDWQQVSNERPEQWRSETCLDAEFFESDEPKSKTGYICGSYEFTQERREESESEMAEEFAEIQIPENNSECKRSVLTINLKPTNAEVKPRIVKAQSMTSLPQKMENGGDLQEKITGKRRPDRRTGSLDFSLAKLRHEMNSLRRQDMELLEQLLNLNNSIQNFKLSQHASLFDSSDESESPEIPIGKPLKPKRWHSRGILDSDRSNQMEITMEKSLKPKRWHCRGSLDSDRSNQRDRTMEKPLKPKHWRSHGNLGSKDLNHPGIATIEKPLKPKRWRSGGSFDSDSSDHAEIAEEKPLKPSRCFSRGNLVSEESAPTWIAMETMKKPTKNKRWYSRGSLGSDESDHSEVAMEKPRRRGSLGSDGSDYHSASSRSSIASGSSPSLSGIDFASYDSGHESGAGLKSCRRKSKGKFGSGDLRRVSFGNVIERSGSEVFLNGSEVVFPAQAARRNSDFRVAEIKSIRTLSKRQSTIW